MVDRLDNKMIGDADNKTNKHSSDFKLQQEKRRLTLLYESLTRSNVLTSGMIATLDNFERKLDTLDELVTPVYEATNELSLLLNNVDHSLSLVDAVLTHYEIVDDLQQTISSGPGGNLNEYLLALDHLENSVKYFKATTAASERERVTQLFDSGIKRLVEETDKLIARYANPLSAKELIELVEIPENNRNGIHAMQEEDLGRLRRIIEWFNVHGYRQGLIDSYATKRGTMIRRSLQFLAENLGKPSIRRQASNVSASNPNLVQSLSISDASNKQTKALGDASLRAARSSATGTLPRSVNPNSSILPRISDENGLLDMSGTREAKNHILLLDSFIVLVQRDHDLLNYVFPNELHSLTYSKLIELPLIYLNEEASRLCASIENLPEKTSAGRCAIYGIFSILKWFIKSRPIFVKLYQKVDDTRRKQLITLATVYEQSAASCLRAFLEEVTADKSPPSQGGNVHPLTPHAMGFMEGLLEYGDAATIIASLYFEQGTSISSPTAADKGANDLGAYFSALIQALYVNLLKKADGYDVRGDATIRSIFLVNNINFLLKRLKNSPLLTIIKKCQSDLVLKLETDFQVNLDEYTKCYVPVISAIKQMFDYDNNNHIPEIKLRDRDREQLKASFTTVNTAIDNIRHQCQSYIISDIDLRDQLRKAGKRMILDIFKKYYDKFAQKDFTKKRDKYVLYEPRALELLIDMFFEHHS